jgi:hypothetical protein
MNKVMWSVAGAALAVTTLGCLGGLVGTPTPTPTNTLTQTIAPQAAQADTPTPTTGGPTPIPPPTRIPSPTQPPEGEAAEPSLEPTATEGAGPYVEIEPNLGPLGTGVRVSGRRFPASSTISLSWVGPGGQSEQFTEVVAGTEGEFTLSLTIPSQWPGGAPVEGQNLQLSAITGQGGDTYVAWANFRYVEPWVPPETLSVTYRNDTYHYAIDLPAGWQFSDSNPANVRFTGPAGGSGFVRVVEGVDENTAANALMAELAPGQATTRSPSALGGNSGLRVVVDATGQVYWFLPHAGRIYTLHFEATTADTSNLILSSFRFTG